MKDECLKWIEKLIYTQMDTMPQKEYEPQLFKSQYAEVKELKKIKKWLKKLK